MALADAVASVVAHWSLDEASGTRADSIGSNDLTDNNTVGSASGMFGNAADFELGNSEYLSIADNADVSTGDIDWMLRVWVNLESKATFQVIVSKDDLGSERDYLLFYDDGSAGVATDRFVWVVFDATGNAVGVVTASNFGSPSTSTWYLLHAWHSATSNEVGIAVNAGTANTAATTGAAGDNDAQFNLGCRRNITTPQNFLDGMLDDPLLMKNYILDATERSEDHNGGAGVAFEDWDAAPATFIPFPRPRGLEAGMLVMSGGMQ